MAVVLKIAAGGDVHRVRLDAPPTYDALDAFLRDLHPRAGATDGASLARYTDEEGDMCRLTRATFADFLETACTTSGGVCPVLRLEVVAPSPVPSEAAVGGTLRRGPAEGGAPRKELLAASRSPSPGGSSDSAGSWVCIEAARERGSSSDGSWVTCAQTPEGGSVAEQLSRAESVERSSEESGALEAGFEPTTLHLAELHADDWGSSSSTGGASQASIPAAEMPPPSVASPEGAGDSVPLLSRIVADEVEDKAVEGTVKDDGAASVLSPSSAGGRQAAEEKEAKEEDEREESAAPDADAIASEQEEDTSSESFIQVDFCSGHKSEEEQVGKDEEEGAVPQTPASEPEGEGAVSEGCPSVAAVEDADGKEAAVLVQPPSAAEVLLQLATAAACPVEAPPTAPAGPKKSVRQGLLLDALDIEAGLTELEVEIPSPPLAPRHAELGMGIPPPPPAPGQGQRPVAARAPGAARWQGSGLSKVVHMGHICDGCEACPLPGPRFTCKVCSDFDLCWTCYMQRDKLPKPHDCTHRFQQVLWSEEVVPACPGGCGFGVTKCSTHPTHCCTLCAQAPGQHTSACFNANAHDDEDLEP